MTPITPTAAVDYDPYDVDIDDDPRDRLELSCCIS